MDARQTNQERITGIARPRSLYASLEYQCEVNRVVRELLGHTDGPVLTPAELKQIDAAWHNGLRAEEFAERVVLARLRAARRQDSMYSSEPIPGRESPFYAGERYFSDAETARRARVEASV